MSADYLPPAYYRLIRDGLIGRLENTQREKQLEIGFQYWCCETLMPEVVNRQIKEIGDATD